MTVTCLCTLIDGTWHTWALVKASRHSKHACATGAAASVAARPAAAAAAAVAAERMRQVAAAQSPRAACPAGACLHAACNAYFYSSPPLHCSGLLLLQRALACPEPLEPRRLTSRCPVCSCSAGYNVRCRVVTAPGGDADESRQVAEKVAGCQWHACTQHGGTAITGRGMHVGRCS